MCGICGIIGQPRYRVDARLLDRMTDIMQHRGPDERGVWINRSGNVGLGARRLSIIGLTNGSQPITNEDQSCVLVANGEIYNYKDLREQLIAKGHRFSRETDIEVILHLYEDRGPDIGQMLNGMFGFAIWDERLKRLVLGRDRMGIKPLFYTQQPDKLIFASEIKSIIEDATVPKRLDLQAMHDYFTFDYIPGEQTIFSDIKKVPAGCVLVFDAKGMRRQRFWDIPFETDTGEASEEYYLQRIRDLLSESVKMRLMSEVPLGVLLSGGMDSSAITAFVTMHSSSKVKTFSIGFEDPSYDELKYARMVARRFETDHYEMIVTAKDVLDVLESHIRYIDEPYADGAAIPTYYVCKIAKEKVTVVLSGEGGDEIFAGYDTHAAYRLASLFRKVPAPIRNRIIRPLVDLMPVSEKKLSFEFKAKRFIRGVGLPTARAHLFWRIVLSEAEKQQLYSPETTESVQLKASERIFEELYNSCPAGEPLNRLLYIDGKVFLPDDLFVKNDRMSMAHSIEARVPMTDPGLVSFMGKVPVKVKMKGLCTKYLLRKAMRGLLPNPIIRKKKVGFDMPYSRWLKREFYDFMMDTFRAPKIRQAGLFNWKFVETLINDHLAGVKDNARPLWGLLNFAIWYRLYM